MFRKNIFLNKQLINCNLHNVIKLGLNFPNKLIVGDKNPLINYLCNFFTFCISAKNRIMEFQNFKILWNSVLKLLYSFQHKKSGQKILQRCREPIKSILKTPITRRRVIQTVKGYDLFQQMQ